MADGFIAQVETRAEKLGKFLRHEGGGLLLYALFDYGFGGWGTFYPDDHRITSKRFVLTGITVVVDP